MEQRNKTTMSVSEMQKLLGLSKTEAYWLVHRGFFETILVEGKMRVVIESFEKWYANQVKWEKVTGEAPGKELKKYSYSIPEIAEILAVQTSIAYDLVKRCGIETFTVDTWKRVRKDVFEAWYNSQSKYRTAADRKRDAEIEVVTMSMPEIARELLITRKEVYRILFSSKNRNIFEFQFIAGRRRVTRKSFEAWYAGQTTYRRLCDRTEDEQDQIEGLNQQVEPPQRIVPDNKPAYTILETAILLNLNEHEVKERIQSGELEAKKYGVKYLILRDEIQWFLIQQKMNHNT